MNHVDGLEKGIYHYLPMEHALEVWDERQDFEGELTQALCEMVFCGLSTCDICVERDSLPDGMEVRAEGA